MFNKHNVLIVHIYYLELNIETAIQFCAKSVQICRKFKHKQ